MASQPLMRPAEGAIAGGRVEAAPASLAQRQHALDHRVGREHLAQGMHIQFAGHGLKSRRWRDGMEVNLTTKVARNPPRRFVTIHSHARPTRPDPAQDPDRTLHRRRPAGRFAHALEVFRPRTLAGDHPQRDVRPRGDGLHHQPAHLRRPRADALGLPSVCRYAAHGAAARSSNICPRSRARSIRTCRNASSARHRNCSPNSPISPAW